MKKRKLGHMHWFFALLLHVVTYILMYCINSFIIEAFLPKVAFPLRLHIALILSISVSRVSELVWFVLTSRRYYSSVLYWGVYIFPLLNGLFDSILQFKSIPLPTVILVLYGVLSLGSSIWMFIYFVVRRPAKETAQAAASSEPSDAQ